MAVFALRKASRRCFLGAIAVLALAIHLFAMAASSGSSAQAIADALLIDAGTSVAFGSVPGAVSGAMDVGTTPDGRLWFQRQGEASTERDLDSRRGADRHWAA